MWQHSDEPADALVWMPDERTAALAERRTRMMVDKVTGTLHLTYIFPSGDTATLVYPPAVARTIGAAMIEGGVLAGGVK
jgi:hypothetical protein